MRTNSKKVEVESKPVLKKDQPAELESVPSVVEPKVQEQTGAVEYVTIDRQLEHIASELVYQAGPDSFLKRFADLWHIASAEEKQLLKNVFEHLIHVHGLSRLLGYKGGQATAETKAVRVKKAV